MLQSVYLEIITEITIATCILAFGNILHQDLVYLPTATVARQLMFHSLSSYLKQKDYLNKQTSISLIELVIFHKPLLGHTNPLINIQFIIANYL